MQVLKQVRLHAERSSRCARICLPPNAVRSSMRVVVDATGLTNDEIPEAVDRFVFLQLSFPYVKPIFLISALDPAALSNAGFMYETVLPESSWNKIRLDASYREYKERRVFEMVTVYQPERMGSIQPGEQIPRWMYER